MTSLTLVWDPETATMPEPLHRSSEPTVPLRIDEREASDERARHVVALLANKALEGLQGRRNLRQLAPLFDDEPLTVMRAWGTVPAWSGAEVRSVRASVLNGRHVEGCARLMSGGRAFMLTLRLAHSSRGWRCTRLDVLCSRGHLTEWGVEAA
ncbi:Rv3235 family protein [Aestuariimicrobium soli]|uniref:Rv3235 family protein n=1 Tax=Aestuariimicrobium soli TaxID=2035834 RepID=UPI003EBCEBC5